MSPLIDALSAASTAVDAANLAYNSKHKLKYYCKKFFKPKAKVLVFGDSGVGKTQFLLTLTGKDSYIAPQRTRQLQHHELILRSGRRVEFIDTPGHPTSSKVRGEALDGMSNGDIDGIINLVDYGYQDSELIHNNPDEVFQNGTSIVKPEYLRNNLKLEIDRTKEIIARINSKTRVKWFITLVNKADIWNSERDKVIQYYSEGDYQDALEHLDHAMRTTTCTFCSVITPFGNKEMPLTYSERNKRADYDSLICTIEEFIEGRHEQ